MYDGRLVLCRWVLGLVLVAGIGLLTVGSEGKDRAVGERHPQIQEMVHSFREAKQELDKAQRPDREHRTQAVGEIEAGGDPLERALKSTD